MNFKNIYWYVDKIAMIALVLLPVLGITLDKTTIAPVVLLASAFILLSLIVVPRIVGIVQGVHVIQSLGIKKVYPSGIPRDILPKKLKKRNIKKIRILAHSANTYFLEYLKEEQDRFVHDGVKIEIVIGTENSDFIRDAEEIERVQNSRISESICDLKKALIKKAKSTQQYDWVKVFQFTTQIRATLFIIDDSCCIYTPTLSPLCPRDTFTLELAPVAKEALRKKSLFACCVDHFEAIKSRSKQWDLFQACQLTNHPQI